MLDTDFESYFDYTVVLDGSYEALALVGLPFSVLLVASDRRHCAFLGDPGDLDAPGDAEMRRNSAGLSRSVGDWGQSRQQTVCHDGLDVLHNINCFPLRLGTR